MSKELHIHEFYNQGGDARRLLCGMDTTSCKEYYEIASTHIENAIDGNRYYPELNRCTKCEEKLPLYILKHTDLE